MTITVVVALASLVLQQPPPPGADSAQFESALATQVMLDRAGFSPGPIDGRIGANTKRALAAFEQQRGTPSPDAQSAVTTYTVTPEDARGPFVESIPSDMVEKARLSSLGYTSIVEALAERFHTTPALLKRLNPDMKFEPGTAIRVPNVEPLALPAEAAQTKQPPQAAGAKPAPAKPTGTAGRSGASASTNAQRPDVVVTVKQSTSDLTVKDGSGKVLLYAPVTTGSQHDPLPIGEWNVTGVLLNPKFHYNPDLFWDADPSHSKATIPSGPNNPVGLAWIDLSKPHYGIHGTPEPTAIGRTESHGCVRLTNWDALKLAGLVKPGTRVIFEK